MKTKIIFILCAILLLTSCGAKDACLDKWGSYNETTKQCEFSEKENTNTSDKNAIFGSWELSKIEEKGKEIPVKRKQDFVLTIDAQGFSSSTDCNTLMWQLTTNNTKISFGDIAGTMMACENSQENLYAEYLRNVESFSLKNTELTLKTKNGVKLIFQKKKSAKIEQKPIDANGNETNEKIQKEIKKVEVKEEQKR